MAAIAHEAPLIIRRCRSEGLQTRTTGLCSEEKSGPVRKKRHRKDGQSGAGQAVRASTVATGERGERSERREGRIMPETSMRVEHMTWTGEAEGAEGNGAKPASTTPLAEKKDACVRDTTATLPGHEKKRLGNKPFSHL